MALSLGWPRVLRSGGTPGQGGTQPPVRGGRPRWPPFVPRDARDTLSEVAGPVGLVLLDGWKDLFLPVIRLLEPRLAPGALIVANDGHLPSAAAYLGYVREPASGYVSVTVPLGDGVEISTWTGR